MSAVFASLPAAGFVLPSSPPPSSPAAVVPPPLVSLLSDFQRSLQAGLQSILLQAAAGGSSGASSSPASSASSSASSSFQPPPAVFVHHWLLQQLLQTLDSAKLFVLSSPAPAAVLQQPLQPPPSRQLQLSHALHELSLASSAVAGAQATEQAASVSGGEEQQQQEQQRRSDQSERRPLRRPAPLPASASLAGRRHRHHVGHGHAVDISVRCLTSPLTSPSPQSSAAVVPQLHAAYQLPHAHAHPHPHLHQHQHAHAHAHQHQHAHQLQQPQRPTAPGSEAQRQSLSVSAVSTAKKEEEGGECHFQSQSPPAPASPSSPSQCCAQPSFLSPVPCLPSCGGVSHGSVGLSSSPCSSPCLMDWSCGLEPPSFSLSGDEEEEEGREAEDPFCCFPGEQLLPADVCEDADCSQRGRRRRRGQDGQSGDEGRSRRRSGALHDDLLTERSLCPSPLSSVCVPMPCDPCALTSTGSTTTTLLSSCLPLPPQQPHCHQHGHDADSQPASPPATDTAAPVLQQQQRREEEEKTAASSSSSSTIPSDRRAASSSLMVSCHQCKLKKPQEQCLQCSCSAQPSSSSSSSSARKDGGGRKRCVKKYCSTCLLKHYRMVMKDDSSGSAASAAADGLMRVGEGWICPACCGLCSCAACSRRKALDEEEAGLLSAQRELEQQRAAHQHPHAHAHHHHAHVTIQSLPHHHHSQLLMHAHQHHGLHHSHAASAPASPAASQSQASIAPFASRSSSPAPLPLPLPPPAPSSLRASCHQCKSSKSSAALLVCSSRRSVTADGRRLRDCRKKFCGVCLEKCRTPISTQPPEPRCAACCCSPPLPSSPLSLPVRVRRGHPQHRPRRLALSGLSGRVPVRGLQAEGRRAETRLGGSSSGRQRSRQCGQQHRLWSQRRRRRRRGRSGRERGRGRRRRGSRGCRGGCCSLSCERRRSGASPQAQPLSSPGPGCRRLSSIAAAPSRHRRRCLPAPLAALSPSPPPLSPAAAAAAPPSVGRVSSGR